MSGRTPVLVVGAGPVGLATACCLLREGVDVRVVEAAEQPQHGSRAIQLHPPTLRLLDHLGVLGEAEGLGLRVSRTVYHLASGRTLNVPLRQQHQPLMIPQQLTCQILERRLHGLGGQVERGVRVTGITEGQGLVRVTTQGRGGPAEIEAEWLVAADGVHSDARGFLGVDFVGVPLTVNFLLAEGEIEGPLGHDEVHYFLGQAGSVVFAAMPHGRTRISAAVPENYPLTPKGVQALLDERGPAGLQVARLAHVGSFGSQERMATRFRVGRCFLAGDAAHTHSPLGGQGLNLGLQDVHNLSWKLAGVVNGVLDPRVLDSYEAERRAAAEQVIRFTRRLLRAFTVGPLAARCRNAAWSGLEATGLLERWFVPALAGARVRYPDAFYWPRPAARPPGRRLDALLGFPRPGRRAPSWALARSGDDDSTVFRLVTLGPEHDELARYGRTLQSGRAALIRHAHALRRGRGFLLIRPDGYVAASGRSSAEMAKTERLLAWAASHGGSE